jgi:hypothetical protein
MLNERVVIRTARLEKRRAYLSSLMLLAHVQGLKLHEQVGLCLPEGETRTRLEASSPHQSAGDWSHGTIFQQ